MAQIGFHAAHELYAPGALLRAVQRAEQAGFTAAMCSDHFHPWSEDQGESGFAWSWLGVAMHATRLPFGTVCAPGQRYHPAVIAQAAATLAEMFPGRFWLAVGSGEALNESITGDPWPPKPERNRRLEACVRVMRGLWAGRVVDWSDGVRVRGAKLYTRPAEPVPVYGAAITAETAEWIGTWADGLITVGSDAGGLRKIIEAFHRGGGRGKPIALQTAVSFAPTEEEALRAAHRRWRIAALEETALADIPSPWEFDAATRDVRPDDLRGKLRISADVNQHTDWLREDIELGFSAIYLHHIGPDLDGFIDAFGERVLPALR